jgi:uncharacterized protein
MDAKSLRMMTFTLVVIGALNWGLVGLLGLNFVEMLLGSWPMLERVVYILVGLSGLMMLMQNGKK